MPKAFPEEFRRDVVAVARRREATMSQVARDFGISESCLARWVNEPRSKTASGKARRWPKRLRPASCGSATACSSRRTRCCAERRSTSDKA